jgi:hypothetical protein
MVYSIHGSSSALKKKKKKFKPKEMRVSPSVLSEEDFRQEFCFSEEFVGVLALMRAVDR